MNKRKYFCFLLVLIFVISLAGCSDREKQESAGYTIYYENASKTSLYEIEYVPEAMTFDDLMNELLTKFSEAPTDAVYTSALPDYVKIQGYQRGIDALRIDFSEEYYDMNNIEEVLLRAAVIKTICQIPGVTNIIITVDSEQLRDADGKVVEAMNEDSFIDTKNGGINSYQYASLVLYFPDQEGKKLIREDRNVDYSSNMVPERVIIEQLIAGSEYLDRSTAVNPSAEVLDISEKNGICTINFSAEFNQIPSENAPSAEAALYSVINSICMTLDNINGVKFTVEGQSNVKFWDEIDLGSVFIMNQGIIETEPVEEVDEAGTASGQKAGRGEVKG